MRGTRRAADVPFGPLTPGGATQGTFLPNGYQGGVKLTRDPVEVGEIAGNMLGQHLVTKQTPAAGVPVNTLMVAQALDIDRETYFAILMDRDHNGPVMVGSPEGTAWTLKRWPSPTRIAIFTVPVDINEGMTHAKAAEMAANLKFEGDQAEQAIEQMTKLYELFISVDATQVEINPFAVTPAGAGRLLRRQDLDSTTTPSSGRRPSLRKRDHTEDDPREVKAAALGLNYIGMEGNIGCLVNGAGLAMGHHGHHQALRRRARQLPRLRRGCDARGREERL